MVQLRKLNAQLARERHDAWPPGSQHGRRAAGVRPDGGSRARRAAHALALLALFTPTAGVRARHVGQRSRACRARSWWASPRACAAGAVWKVFHAVPRRPLAVLLGGVARRTRARWPCNDGTRVDADSRRCRSRRARDVPAAARDPGRVELRDAARQRHRVLRRAGAAAACPAAGRDGVSRGARAAEPVLQRASVPRGGRRGALARAELDGEPPARIERFRTALCGPLGSVGDRLVWAAGCRSARSSRSRRSGFGVGPWRRRRCVPGASTTPATSRCAPGDSASGSSTGCGWRRRSAIRCCVAGPQHIGAGRRALGGIALPLALDRVIGPGRALLGDRARRRRARRRRCSLACTAAPKAGDRASPARAVRPLLGGPLMAERYVQIVNKNGLHARPAAEIVKAAARFKSDITIVRDDLEVNGKSIMGVMMLAAEYGSTNSASRRRPRRARTPSTRSRRSSRASSARR